jgi:hypothetical protein
MHASIVIAFDNELTAKKALKNKLFIAGIPVKTAKYEEKKTTIQCQKCQKFGHTTSSCKNLAICQYCAQNHLTRLHICKICESVGEICIHTILKCSNCGGNHAATSKECTDNQQSSTDQQHSTEIVSDSQIEQMLNQESMEIEQ